jgi:hypothetical protein
MSVAEREQLYSSTAGISRRAAHDFRLTPVNEWTQSHDRVIGRTIRGLERMAQHDDLPKNKFVRAVRELLTEVFRFIHNVAATVENLLDALASAAERIAWALRTFVDALRDLLRLLAGAGVPIPRALLA